MFSIQYYHLHNRGYIINVVIEYLEDLFFAPPRQEYLWYLLVIPSRLAFLILEIESAKSPSVRE